MSNCLFTSKYFDYEKKCVSKYVCEEPQLSNGFCIFHKQNTLNKDIIKKFKEKVEKAVKNKVPLFGIGYELPEIKLKVNFSKPVYLKNSKFQALDFHQSRFKELDLSAASILGPTNFEGTDFFSVDFIKTKFFGPSNFNKTKVRRGANFFGAEFNKNLDFAESSLRGPSFIGANFESVDFSFSNVEPGYFQSSNFHGKANFVSSELSRINFSQTSFEEKADFSSAKILKSNFSGTKFTDVNFANCEMGVVSFARSFFKNKPDFNDSKLNNVDFFDSNFKLE